ncbi:MAG: hypothetical protein IJ608_05400 [Lachnospiraceae bacterium]|nr:hypothetical protein [Lachnospiraceae bacterium]MBR1857783.1 hypothetical protein [Oribacterium sp.]
MKKDIKVNIGFGFLEALAIAFVVLKLTGFITWSWLWVLAPIWIQLILAVIGFIAFLKVAAHIYKDDWLR